MRGRLKCNDSAMTRFLDHLTATVPRCLLLRVNRLRRRAVVSWILLTSWIGLAAGAAEPSAQIPPDDPMPPNVESPTFGGFQWWGDELVFHDWRVQRHVKTGHYRLLDSRNVRHAWGTLEQCRQKLDEVRHSGMFPPMKGKVVLLVHGMLRTRASMHKMADAIDATGQFEAVAISYPSTRAGIAYHSRAFASILDSLGPEVTQIDVVAHSLGNLVVRHYFGLHPDASGPAAYDARIKRLVMLGPPNHPPERARRWVENSLGRSLYYWALPGTGAELTEGFAELEPKLAVPPCEFGILAGGKGDGKGWHSLLPGDDDSTVTVEETRLGGAHDFAVLPVLHTFLMSDARMIECTLRFLNEGCFYSEARRQPLPPEPAAKLESAEASGPPAGS